MYVTTPCRCPVQGQANKWVKQMEKKHQLEVLKLSGGPDTYMRQLENAVQFGFPVLIEVSNTGYNHVMQEQLHLPFCGACLLHNNSDISQFFK